MARSFHSGRSPDAQYGRCSYYLNAIWLSEIVVYPFQVFSDTSLKRGVCQFENEWSTHKFRVNRPYASVSYLPTLG